MWKQPLPGGALAYWRCLHSQHGASLNCGGQSSVVFSLSLPIFCDCLLKDTESKEANVSLPHLNSSCISAGSVLPLSTAFLYILIFFEQRLYISLWYDMRDHDTCVLCVRMSLTSGSFSEATLFLCSLGLRRYGCLWVARCILASRFCIWSSFPLVHT